MNVPLFLVLLGSLTLTHLHFTYPTVAPPSFSAAHPTPEKSSEFWSEGKVFHLKNLLNEKEDRILTFALEGFSSPSDGALLVSTKRSPVGQTWMTSLPNGETLKLAKTRPLSGKKGGLVEYSVVWKVAQKLPRGVDSREVCFLYDTTTPTMPPATPTKTHWYSTFLEKHQAWPLNSGKRGSDSLKATPFTTNSTDAPIGSTVEYLFYSSAGFALFLDDLHPWTIAVNESTFCLSIPQMAPPPEVDHPLEYGSLKWRILVAPDLPSLWKASLGTFQYLSRPSAPPSSSLLQRLIWSVSLIPKVSTQDWVADIAYFKEHPNAGNACLYIDSNYKWGNAPFVLPGKSGDQLSLVQALQKAGSPIAYHLSQAYLRKYTPKGTSCVDAVKEEPKKPKKPGTPSPWCTLDFTHAPTALWFTAGLEEFTQRTAISTFFLKDATVDKFFPKEKLRYTVENSVLLKYPNFLTTLYASSVLPVGRGHRGFAIDGAFKCQRLSAFITFNLEIEDDNDLHLAGPSSSTTVLSRLIPKLLTLSLAGYQFAFPRVSLPNKPKQDEYLRWLAACLFLPALELSVSPWNLLARFEPQMVRLLELRVAVHAKVQMETLVGEWIHRGVPIIRPMWAADETDENLLTLDDQYMLGSDLIVAPYLGKMNDKSQLYERAVYLPRGAQWRDSKGNVLPGGGHIKVNSTVIDPPYFTRQEKDI